MITSIERFSQILNEDGTLTVRAATFFEELTRETNLNTPIQGTGSPETVIDADIGQRYLDTAGLAENVLYIKQSGTGNTGWILV